MHLWRFISLLKCLIDISFNWASVAADNLLSTIAIVTDIPVYLTTFPIYNIFLFQQQEHNEDIFAFVLAHKWIHFDI